MAERRCKKCGKQTNNASGICSSCRIDMEFEDLNTPWVKRETRDRNTVTAEQKKEEEPIMATKKKCGCGRPVQKEGLCYKCYKDKHGCAPYPGQGSKSKKPGKKNINPIHKTDGNMNGINNSFMVSQAYLDARSALQNLGYKKTMAESALASIQGAESLSLDEVIKAALKAIGNPKGLVTPPPPIKNVLKQPSSPVTEAIKSDGTYIISVDFTKYPGLHELLIKRADDEIRSPGAQLVYMLRETLQEMEERA